ncbi:X-linked lymphocyte-regulated protein 3A-like isoform X1 [Rattus rattus]|uniref:X-linked lymphocyte-regulated protein 3A-like isoform X1 n=1 Tax=Rattus rattus TaxID=10117 RepID=UPI0013F2CC1D|nr:X-linked lymphocyte-regulated protein 3A-like isoform X1 [Rattus rattus]
MSSSERKATASVDRHPTVVPNLSSDDSQDPPGAIAAANKEVPVAGREETIASGTERQQDRKKKQDLFQELEEPIQKVLQENRERFLRIVASSFLTMEVKVKDILKTQCEQRQKLYQDYSLQVTNLSKKLTTDANQVKKHAEKLCNMFMEQQKFIHESLTLQKNRMEEFKALCEEYLEKFEVLRDSQANSIAEELRCLIATLK